MKFGAVERKFGVQNGNLFRNFGIFAFVRSPYFCTVKFYPLIINL